MMVLVTGASGILGRCVVDALAARGVRTRGMGRRAPLPGASGEWHRADLLSAAGLPEAVDGAAAVVHCASNPFAPDEDVRALDNLLAAVRPGGSHLVYVGIAGIEDAASALRYYRVKLACEHRLIASGIPHTICRATQFHPFVDYMLGRLGWGPVQFCPAMRLQPVDPRFVAARLADLCASGPQGRSADVFGPEALSMTELVTPWLRARGRRRWCVPVPRVGILSALGRLDLAVGRSGGLSWRDWLSDTGAGG